MDPSRIIAARHALLALHKAIIAAERVDLERIEGRLAANQMLDRLVTDERFAWLRPMTALIVALDELLEGDVPADAETYVARAIELLTPEAASDGDLFAVEYLRLLHERPEVTMEHASAMRVLRAKG